MPALREVVLVDVPAMRVVMVEGTGDPVTSPDYAEAAAALVAVTRRVRQALRRRGARDVGPVPPLETLWWSEGPWRLDGDDAVACRWTVMVGQPEGATADLVHGAVAEVAGRGGASPALALVRFVPFDEGPALQVLHVGPLPVAGATLSRLRRHMADHGFGPAGPRHEIYLSGPRTTPERRRTVVRCSVTRR